MQRRAKYSSQLNSKNLNSSRKVFLESIIRTLQGNAVDNSRALVSAAYLERRSERRSPALSAELSASSFEIMSAKMSASLFFNDR